MVTAADSDENLTNGETIISPDSPLAYKEASDKIDNVISCLREDGIDPGLLMSNLEYISEVLRALVKRGE